MPGVAPVPFTEALGLVKASLDIVALIGRHVPLKRRGRNYIGLCPFHAEKSPSFAVNAEKGVFKCFGCGEGGDAIAFLMKQNHQDFRAVVGELAQELGIEIAETGASPEEVLKRKRLEADYLELNQAAQQWFSQQLMTPEWSEAQEYLSKRGLKDEVIRRFRLGYAPKGWTGLHDALKTRFGADPDFEKKLLDVGLQSQGAESGRIYDRFRHRLVFPILGFDKASENQPVGFGGRVLDDPQTSQNNEPKYLNSPETPLYHKSQMLYGLAQAREAIKTHKRAVICEGYFDVISLHAVGMEEAVGVCGTALTVQHLQLLSRFGAEAVYLAFDSDTAGQRATERAVDVWLDWQASKGLVLGRTLELHLVDLPGGKDPDDWARQLPPANRHEAIAHVFEKAIPALDAMCSQAIAAYPQDAVARGQALVGVLAKLDAQPVLQHELLTRYADEAQLPADVLGRELALQRQRRQVPSLSGGARSQLMQTPAVRTESLSWKKQGKSRKNKVSRPVIIERNPVPLRRDIAAGRTLLALMLSSTEAWQAVFPRVAQEMPILSDAADDAMLKQLMALGSPQDSVETIRQHIEHWLDAEREQLPASIAQSWAGVLMGSDLQTDANQPVEVQVETLLSILRQSSAQARLNQLNAQCRTLEQDASNPEQLITLQYELRQRLNQPT